MKTSLVLFVLSVASCGILSAQDSEPRLESDGVIVQMRQLAHEEALFGAYRLPPASVFTERQAIQSISMAAAGRKTRMAKLPQALASTRQISEPARTVSILPQPAAQLEGFPGELEDYTSGIGRAEHGGAVGTNHVVELTNQNFRVMTKKGVELMRVSSNRFFNSLGGLTTNIYGPRVQWDINNKRFLVTAMSEFGKSNAGLLFGFSVTDDPTGEWKLFRILANVSNGGFYTNNSAVAGKYFLVSADAFQRNFDNYLRTMNFVINLEQFYKGSSIYSTFNDFFLSNTPASDANPNASSLIFINSGYYNNNGNFVMLVKEVTTTSAGINVGNMVILDAGDSLPDAVFPFLPQLGSVIPIDAGIGRHANCVAKLPAIYCSQQNTTIYSGKNTSVVQIYQINRTGLNTFTSSFPTRIDDTKGVHYAYPSIALNSRDDIFLGYNKFSKDAYAKAVYAFRRKADAPASYFIDGLLKEGEDVYEDLEDLAFGQFSSTQVDPVDDSFWTFQVYPATNTESGVSRFATWIAHYTPRATNCTVRLDSTSATVPATGANVRVTVTPNQADCSWVASPNAQWISAPARPLPVGVGTVEFRVGLNRRPNTRTATITLGDQSFTVTQAANPNPPAPEPVLVLSRFDAPASAKAGETISVTARVANNGTKNAGRFRVGFYLSTKAPVTANDTFTGAGCVLDGLGTDVTQSCTATIDLDGKLAPGTYQLAAIADDRSEVVTTDRTQATRLSDAGALVVQAAATAPTLSSAGLVNAATAKPGAVAPGELLVVYGARLGPAALTTLALDATGKVATTLAGTRILFDGVAAPLIYTSSGQASVIVPYSVSGKTATQIVAEYNGVKSLALTATVALSSPGLFTVDFSGANQVAALNEDGSVNSADNPAEAGKLIVLYGTGGGTFKTQPVDGAVIGLPLPEFLAPLSLTIGGQPAEVLYAGPAPGLVSGVLQINARVPAGTAAGDKVALQVKSGDFVSPAGTTIAVK